MLLQSKRKSYNQQSTELDLIVFTLQGYHFALESNDVKEYLTNVKVIPLPQSENNHLLGLMNLRGEYYTVVDLTAQLNLTDHARHWNFNSGKVQKILVLNAPKHKTDSHLALIVENLTLLFKVPISKIQASIPAITNPTFDLPASISKTRRKNRREKDDVLQNSLVGLLKGLLHDEKLGLVFYLNGEAIHDLIDQSEVDKINPISLLNEFSKRKQRQPDSLGGFFSFKPPTSGPEQQEFLIVRISDMFLGFPHENVQALGTQDEFFILHENEATNFPLPSISGINRYLLHDNRLLPIISLPTVLSSILSTTKRNNNTKPHVTDHEMMSNNDEMIFILKDPTTKKFVAMSLDDCIDLATPINTLPLHHPLIYPHLKSYYPLIEKLAIFKEDFPQVKGHVTLILNVSELIELASRTLNVPIADLAGEQQQLLPEQVSELMINTSRFNPMMTFFQQLEGMSTPESYITFDLTSATSLAVPTNILNKVLSTSELDVSPQELTSRENPIIRARNMRNGNDLIILNPQRLVNEDVSTDITPDEVYVITLLDTQSIPNTEQPVTISLSCINPQPMMTLHFKKIPKSEIKRLPPEMARLPIDAELKPLLDEREQKRIFVLNVNDLITNMLQQFGGA